jgi:hypothetical protein
MPDMRLLGEHLERRAVSLEAIGMEVGAHQRRGLRQLCVQPG